MTEYKYMMSPYDFLSMDRSHLKIWYYETIRMIFVWHGKKTFEKLYKREIKRLNSIKIAVKCRDLKGFVFDKKA